MKTLALQDFDETFGGLGGGAHGEPADYCSRDGALNLKAKIEAYWKERGHTVMIALHNVGFHPAIRAARYDVRSDMVNGMPRVRANGQGPAPVSQDVFVDEFDADDVAFD
jgi:hypothetical protein